jgi:repressor LexA
VAGRRQAEDGPDPGLSERQQQILEFIEAYTECHGVSPSYREIGDAVGLKAISAVKYQVEQLQEKGCLARRDRMPRTIVTKPRRLRSIAPEFDPGFDPELDGVQADPGSDDMVSMPLFESVAAGTGVDANRDAVGSIRLPRDVVGYGNVFAVRVAGDSMVGVDIFDGDYVVVRQQNDAVNGDVVAALREDDEGVVKTFRRTEDHVWLMPENSGYDPILGDDYRIMGKVVATLHSRRAG